MSGDDETMAVYAAEAGRYADLTGERSPELDVFLGLVTPGGRILDLGCGPGHDAAVMAGRGFEVDAMDASAEMVAEAQARHGLAARVAGFDDVDAEASYDGVWASFSLLHAPKADMPGHLRRLHSALRPGGRIMVGLKTGEGERRDRLGRFYAYYTRDELVGLMEDAGFGVTSEFVGADAGLDGAVAPWIMVQAHA